MSLRVLARTEPLLLQDLARASGRGDALGLEEPSGGWVLGLVALAVLAAAFPLVLGAFSPGAANSWPALVSRLPGGGCGLGALAAAVGLLAAWLLAHRLA